MVWGSNITTWLGWYDDLYTIKGTVLTITSGIILLDPQFKPKGRNPLVSEHRSFSARPKNLSYRGEEYPRNSSKDCFCFCIFHDPQLLRIAVRYPFAILRDLLRIIASEWLTVNACVKRELSTIEIKLEKEQPSLDELEVWLKSLFIHRRRISKYQEHIRDTLRFCTSQGQPCWPKNTTTEEGSAIASDLEDDFKGVEELIGEKKERISKDITLLASLIALEEGRQSTKKNQGIARLTTIATIFLPFSTIATILGMQGNYSPNAERFWVFWAVAVPVTAVIVLLYWNLDPISTCIKKISTTGGNKLKRLTGD